MKTVLPFFIVLFLQFYVFSQTENNSFCHKRNQFSNQQLKSNSLTVSQIADAERYDVHFYALNLSMTNTSTSLSGTGEIHGTAKESLDSVLFELFSTFTITDIRLNGTTVNYSRNASAIKVPVNLLTGESFKIEIDYNGTPPTAATNPLGGSGMTNAVSGSWGNQVTYSLSEPFSAYEWWPCKQSLTDKADSCSVKITVPSNCKAGSNGTLENVIDLGNGTTRYEWMHRHSIDYYLISVAIAEYIEYNVYANPLGSTSPVLIQNFIYNNPSTLPTFQNDIDETVSFMELFANIYGPYPYDDEKYGHCMAPLGGGMEHQTMTTQGWFSKGLTSHELAHQWWGNNVTCASWTDIWVNEGFASYSSYLMLENLYPNETTGDMLNKHSNIKSQPGGSVWCLDSLNESRIFNGRLTYDKGAAILHTFRFIMNDDATFFNTLQQIQTDFADSTIHGITIRDYFTQASSIDFTDAFDQWYFGEGYPTYSVRWNNIDAALYVEINQTTSSTTPLFTNDIELRVTRTGMNDTIVRVPVAYNGQQHVLSGMDNVSDITQIDPNNWIINNQGSIIKDPNFGNLGLFDAENSNTYSIFPNPSEGIFTISSTGNGENKIELYDIQGKEVSATTFSHSITIDLSNEESGYYILYITNDKGERICKTISKK